jgi:molybdenum-dependent DNA-binding transcriptional regulator ModE
MPEKLHRIKNFETLSQSHIVSGRKGGGGLGSDQVNCLIEQIISIKKGLISGLEPQFERQNRREQRAVFRPKAESSKEFQSA